MPFYERSALQHIRSMEIGFTKPQLFRCNDGRDYVVKFMSNPMGLRSLFSELICYRLGVLLQIPIPEATIVRIDERLINSNSILRNLKVMPGPHFGSLYIPDTQHLSSKLVPKCHRPDIIASVIVFDHWITNYDRWTNSTNILVKKSDRSLLFIDHANAFDKWKPYAMKRLRERVDLIWGHVYEQFAPYIDSKTLFEPVFTRLEAITPDVLWQQLKDIPPEWGMSPSELEEFVEHLMERKRRLKRTIRGLRCYFPIWGSARRQK